MGLISFIDSGSTIGRRSAVDLESGSGTPLSEYTVAFPPSKKEATAFDSSRVMDIEEGKCFWTCTERIRGTWISIFSIESG